ncbi:MAG: right-handed parallel beta-helix repeat-containing protein [Polyangiaceae bacterium]
MRNVGLGSAIVAATIFCALGACGGGDDSSGTGPSGGSGDGGAGVTGDAASPPADSCEAFGHFGKPAVTFDLPVVGSGAAATLVYADVQKSFPSVDWTHLDRLYLPAGKYPSLMLGNLPARDPAHPLVITNKGGQVFVGDNPKGNYLWSMGGTCTGSGACTSVSSGWVLTGRYDPDSQTGDVGFQGHRCGKYASSQDTYGIVSDDGFAFDAPYLHMGIAVQGATQFEIEYVEIRRSGFAGIRLLNPRASGDAAQPMEDVKVHDVYVHDTGGEGFYFGWTGAPPSNLFPGLQIYNCRILRTGNEALQIQDLGEGSHVYNNVFAAGGLHWLDNGLGLYQDNNSQIQMRSGNIEIDHNVAIDGAGSVVVSFTQPEPGDADVHAKVHDDYFANTLDVGLSLNGTPTTTSTYAFENDLFTGMAYGYQPINSKANAPGAVFNINVTSPVSFTNDSWDGTRELVNGITGGNGTKDNTTGSGNVHGAFTPIAFENAGFPIDNPGHHLTAYVPTITTAGATAMGQPVSYKKGDVVTYGAAPDLYQASADTTAGPPDAHPEAWTKLPTPIDDVRVKSDSPYAAMGVK